MRWIALHLPLLSLETFTETLSVEMQAAVVAGQRPVALVEAHHITCANAVAQARGVKSGVKRATALALAPDIVLGQASPSRDRLGITGVAHAALAFTPAVALDEPAGHPADAPNTVLLEVQASLRYFGGLRALLHRLHRALAPLNHVIRCASAPTAAGAALLARRPQAPEGRHADDLPALHRLLGDVPLWLLGPARAHGEALQSMGLRTLSDLRSLPRHGLARRFGEPLLKAIDQARGAQPDPREFIVLPEHFESRLELFARAETTEQVQHGAAILVARLVAWASARHAQVRRYTLRMQHEPRHRRDADVQSETRLDIVMTRPTRDASHLLVLLRERLARLELPAPTLELRLDCDDVTCAAVQHGELFPTARSEHEGLGRLIERLQARLGHEQVQRLALIEDHRPEFNTAPQAADAWTPPASSGQKSLREQRATLPFTLKGPHASSAEGAAQQRAPVDGARPVWLWAEPEPLKERESHPLLDGRPLRLLCGPERIESGWWDASLVERDYFIAQAGDGALVWIYRARVPKSNCGWFLHGRFG
jgi:protein ImuB